MSAGTYNSQEATEWHPALLLKTPNSTGVRNPLGHSDSYFSLIILNQPLKDLQTLTRLWWNSSYRVAADGGANRIYNSNQRCIKNPPVQAANIINDLDVITGDLDSLTTTTRDYFQEATKQQIKIIHDSDQYSTDFGKAVKHIRHCRPKGTDIVAMGGLGGRVDQGLSQLHHLYTFQDSTSYAEGKLFLVSGESLTFLLKEGRHRIHVRERQQLELSESEKNEGGVAEVFGKYVGIIPVKEPSVITTKGLEWDVEDWPTEFGGQMSTSNHVLPETEVVEVTTTKDVLFTISLKEKESDE